jgi:hypothetical protein
MIGAIREAKETAKPAPSAAPAKLEAQPAAKPGLTDTGGLPAKATSEPQPNTGATSQLHVEHAGGTHES